MITIAIPALVALVGLLMYAFASNHKLARVGEIMFQCGLLVALFAMGAHPLRFG